MKYIKNQHKTFHLRPTIPKSIYSQNHSIIANGLGEYMSAEQIEKYVILLVSCKQNTI